MDRLDELRRAYAAEVQAIAGLEASPLVEALAKVPRERFLGPGPWKVMKPLEHGLDYLDTPDADPAHVYHDVLVALDASRMLNNGQPSGVCRWLNALALKPGERALHVGCGTGYYSALMAELVGPSGHVLAVEVDEGLAAKAREDLAPWPQVTVLHGDGNDTRGERDALFVNAGATHPLPAWLDALAPGGRLVLPLTVSVEGNDNVGWGLVLLATREARRHSARFISPVGIFHCVGARDADMERQLADMLQRDAHEAIRSLRRDAHAPGPSCVVHGQGFCLSTE